MKREKTDFWEEGEKIDFFFFSIQELTREFWGRKMVNPGRRCAQGWCFLGGLQGFGAASAGREEGGGGRSCGQGGAWLTWAQVSGSGITGAGKAPLAGVGRGFYVGKVGENHPASWCSPPMVWRGKGSTCPPFGWIKGEGTPRVGIRAL